MHEHDSQALYSTRHVLIRIWIVRRPIRASSLRLLLLLLCVGSPLFASPQFYANPAEQLSDSSVLRVYRSLQRSCVAGYTPRSKLQRKETENGNHACPSKMDCEHLRRLLKTWAPDPPFTPTTPPAWPFSKLLPLRRMTYGAAGVLASVIYRSSATPCHQRIFSQPMRRLAVQPAGHGGRAQSRRRRATPCGGRPHPPVPAGDRTGSSGSARAPRGTAAHDLARAHGRDQEPGKAGRPLKARR